VTLTRNNAEQFLRGRELSIRSPDRAWKSVTEGDIYIVLGLFTLMGKPVSVSNYNQSNQSMTGVNSKDQLPHSYLTEKKRMNK
jgi:hypothetical protein